MNDWPVADGAPGDERWARLQRLFLAAVELPDADTQTHFVERENAGDPEMRSLLAGMLAGAAGAGSRIAGAIEQLAREAGADRWKGRRLGPYRIVREIGRGGMGIVFEAERDDDQYRKRVALKIAPGWTDASLMHERLRGERQILAELEHPNIARFLDGGTEDGVPFIAMEYVDGRPVTEYVRDRPLRRRIELFRHIAAAVQYAHQNLIVHRDLKPANILVTADGVPKLLDFGIAKILSAAASSGTTAGFALTPDYTSPEQVRGQRITTRTDVYSLGLILYELLCGERAQIADTSSPFALDRSISEFEPVPPSQRAASRGDRVLGRQLQGDLDAIVSKAIRKEPERRYESVADMSDDLGRYLEGLPVKARSGTFAYRSAKLLRRHWVGATATVLVAASLAIGLGAALYQARRAERRFQQVRKLADTFVFDLQDRIENLPGSSDARKWAVQTALSYLEGLRSEAAGNAPLLRDVAAAYAKVGEQQGLPTRTNLGDTAGAIASFGRAEAILTDLVRRGDRWARLPLGRVHIRTAQVHRFRGEMKAALDGYAMARTLYDALKRESPDDRETLEFGGELYSEVSLAMFGLRDAKGATEAAASGMEIAKRLAGQNPADKPHREQLAAAHSALARAEQLGGRMEEALVNFRAAVEIREQLVRDTPNDVSYRRGLLVGYGNLGDVLGYQDMNLGDTAGAAAAFRKALDMARWLSVQDSADRRSQIDMVNALMRLGALLLDDPAKAADALRPLEEAEGILKSLLAEDSQNARNRYYAAYVDSKIGRALERLGREPEAERRMERSAAVAAELVNGPDRPGARALLVSAQARLAAMEAGRGDRRALELANAVAHEADEQPPPFSSAWTQAAVCHDLSVAYRRMGREPQAADWLERGRQILRDVKLPARLEARRAQELAALAN